MILALVLATSGCATPTVPDGNRFEFAFATPDDCAVVAAAREAWPLPGQSEAITGLIRDLEPVGGAGLGAQLGPPNRNDRVGPLNLSNCSVTYGGSITAAPVRFLTPVYSEDRTLALTGVSVVTNQWKVALLVRQAQGWRVREWADYRPIPPTDVREIQ